MALPTFVGVTAGDVPHSSGALSVPLPAGIAAKDKLFLFINCRASESIGAITGWAQTSFSPIDPGAGDYELTIFQRDATGTDTDPTVPDSGDHQIAFIAAFRSGTGALLEIKHSNTGTAAASTSLSFPTITTTGNDYLVINAVSDDWDAQDATRYSAWANASLGSVTERYDGGWTTNGGGGLGLATGTKATAGAVSATTATLASSVAVSMATFAIGDVASAGTDALLANDVSSGTPTVGTPAIGQIHVIAANDVASGTPSVSTPALGQKHALLANDVAASAPSVTSPAIGQVHGLLADDVATGAPSVTTPAIGQVHVLDGADIASGTPTVSAPALGTDGTDALSAEDISSGVPTVGTPTLGQVHALLAESVSAGVPSVSSPALGSTAASTATSSGGYGTTWSPRTISRIAREARRAKTARKARPIIIRAIGTALGGSDDARAAAAEAASEALTSAPITQDTVAEVYALAERILARMDEEDAEMLLLSAA